MRDATPNGPAWDGLRLRVAELQTILERPRVSLVELGRAYQALAGAMLEVASASGQTSARFEAAARSLDLKTPKSALHAFLGR